MSHVYRHGHRRVIMGTRLVKSSRDKKILGVCGGIAQYLHIDSTLVRIIWAIAICCFGSGLLLYFIFGLIMPQDMGQNDYNRYNNYDYNNNHNNYNNGYNNYNNCNNDYPVRDNNR
jgi:phage shock protein PspC (stress-responsive transcriptional regulator)